MPHAIIPSFNAGELSPRLHSRVDLEKYGSGCKTLENFIPMPYGGVNRRPGMKYMGEVKDSTKPVRLIGFNFSTTTNFILEFGDEYVRFWTDGDQVESGGSPYEIVSPYDQADLFELQYVQINDVMYIAHPDYPVYKLSRIADDSWTLAEVEWDYPPFLDENLTSTTMTLSNAAVGTGRTLTASAATFTAANVGSYYRIGHRRSNPTVTKALTAAGTSSDLRVIGTWELTTTGLWTGTITVQRTYDLSGSTGWETIRGFQSTSDRNISASGTEERECLVRIGFSYSAHTGSPVSYLEAVESTVYGVVKVTGYTSTTVVTVEVLTAANATTATTIWAEGAWSPRRGYPRAVCLHDQRLWFGGTSHKAQTFWGSAIDDFENFRLGSLDANAVEFTLASAEQNAINWMVSQQVLCIGTTGDEYIVDAGDTGTTITATSIRTERQSRYGSKYSQALLINEVALFVQRQGRKIREFVYSFDKDGYVAPDLTLLAEHVTEGGVKQTAFQQQPDAILWAVTGDSELIGMTYERDQKVVGWHRHSTDGTVESVATIYGDGDADELWLVVNRTINGSTKRFVERLDPDYRITLDAGEPSDWFYVDSGLTLTPSGLTVSGLSHLNGETVKVLLDGATHPNCTVSAGAITLERTGTVAQVGLGYTSTLEPLGLEVQQQDGTSQGRKFRVHRIATRLYKSACGEIYTGGANWDELILRDTAHDMDEPVPVFTGETETVVASGFNTGTEIKIRQTAPTPLTILAVIPKFDVYGE